METPEIKFADLRPGDVLFLQERRYAVFVIAINETEGKSCVDITFMALFGCMWNGIRTIKYSSDGHASAGHEVWRL